MLNPASVLKKTDAGVTAIKDRDRSVVPRARTLLIMVDGSKTVAQLAAMNIDAVQGTALLEELAERGFVVATGVQAVMAGAKVGAGPAQVVPPEPTVSSATPAAAERRPEPDIKTSIRNACRFLENWLGPQSEPLCLQLERCKTRPEFVSKAGDIAKSLAAARSAKKADEFLAVALGA